MFLSLCPGLYAFFSSHEEKLLLKENKDGCFSVKLFYKVLNRSNSVMFTFRSIWNSCIPTKVSFFSWKASWGNAYVGSIKEKGESSS